MKIKITLLLSSCFFLSNSFSQCITPNDVLLTSVTPSTICGNNSTQIGLYADAGVNSVAWYDAPVGGNLIGVSAPGDTLYVNASSTTTYYAQAYVQGALVDSIFNYTGSEQVFSVPLGVTSLSLELLGAQGNHNALGVVGGLGGQSNGELSVSAGDQLYIYVGQGGTQSSLGGFNGGGDAGSSPCLQAIGGGGGGATDIRYGGNTINDRVIVAAGGGGAGGNRVATCGRGTGGGGGGGYYGGGGGAAWPSTSITLPTGGTQTAAGTGGISDYATLTPTNYGINGNLNIGGKGGDETSSNQAGAFTASTGAAGGGLIGDNGAYSGSFTGQSGAGGSSYIGGVTSATTLANVNSGNGMAKITYYDVCLSMNRMPITITFNPLPVLNVVSTSSTICEYTLFEFLANGGDSIAWNGPSVVDNNSIITTTLADSGTYVVTAFDLLTGCSSSDSIELVILDGPDVTISSNGITFCSGDTLDLIVNGGDTYTWSNGITTSNQSFPVTSSDIISVESSLLLTGCSYSDTLNYSVNSLPNVSIGSSSTIYCVGDTIELTADGAQTYLWENNAVSSILQFVATNNDTLTVVGTDTSGCENSATFDFVVNPLPPVGLNLTVTSTCSNAAPFNLEGGIPLGGTWSGTAVSTDFFTPASGIIGSNLITYSFTDLNNCTNIATQSIDVIDCAGLEEFENESIQLSPNPFTTSLTVTSKTSSFKQITLYNQEGKVVFEQFVSGNNVMIDLSSLSNGLYIMSILTDSDNVVKRIEKM